MFVGIPSRSTTDVTDISRLMLFTIDLSCQDAYKQNDEVNNTCCWKE